MHTKEKLEQAIKVSNNYSDICRYFNIIPKGGNFTNIKREISYYGLDISHFTKHSWNKGLHYISQSNKPLDDILVENSNYNSSKLKLRLIKNEIKEYKCERCGRNEWEGEKIPLELHHINGNHTDNRIGNLQILCPNCHALTKNYRGANQDRYKDIVKKSVILTDDEYNEYKRTLKEKQIKTLSECPICHKMFKQKNKNQKFCSQECATKNTSKKPSLEELKKDIETFGFNQTKISQK
mgnify:CR=1 FL=1